MAVIQNVELKSKKGRAFMTIVYTVLILYMFVQFAPLVWLALGTFKENKELISAVPSFLPKVWSTAAYAEVFSKYNVWGNIANTAIISGAIIVIQTVTSTLAAYSLSKMKPKCGGFLYMFILGTQMFTAIALMFPIYILMTKLGLIGNKWSWILSSSAWAYAIVLYKNFFDSIPADMIEAAQIDGAGHIKIILRIMLPLAKPIYAVCILNTFMSVYNDFLLPMMLLPNEKDWTLMMRIFAMNNNGDIKQNVMFVMLFITCIPSIVFYLFAQKYIQEGISTTGVKG